MTQHKRSRRRLHVGRSIADSAFDALIPDELRHLSRTHWTPVDVAVRAASWLSPSTGTRVLDVGSGVGKLCTVGALSSTAVWCGVELHEELVVAARRLSRSLGIGHRTLFLHGDVLGLDWSDFDAVYLYNPFEIPLFPEAVTAQEHELAFKIQVARVQIQLARLRTGTRVLTFHGFGGAMPSSYELVNHERVPIVGLDLALWIQRSGGRSLRRPS